MGYSPIYTLKTSFGRTLLSYSRYITFMFLRNAVHMCHFDNHKYKHIFNIHSIFCFQKFETYLQ